MIYNHTAQCVNDYFAITTGGIMKENTSIKVCGKKYDTGTRVVLWDEEEGMSFYSGGPWSKGRFSKRDVSLKKLQKLIDGFYIHHTVTYTVESTFRVLKSRNLSCNFIIDDDVNENGCATIYQLLDVKDGGWSQGGEFNRRGAGVEIAYYPDAWENPHRYNEYNRKKWGVQKHDTMPEKVQGMNFSKVFKPTDAQVQSCIKLIYGYSKAFPELKLAFPRDDEGNFIQKEVEESKKIGLLHHFNITSRKIDAMGFPTDFVEEEVNKLVNEDKNEPKIKDRLRLTRKWFVDKILNRETC